MRREGNVGGNKPKYRNGHPFNMCHSLGSLLTFASTSLAFPFPFKLNTCGAFASYGPG